MLTWLHILAIGASAASPAPPQAPLRDTAAALEMLEADTAGIRLPQSFPSDSRPTDTGISPVLAAGASFVLPGLGQILTHHPVKGGVAMALDLALYSNLWQIQNTQLPKLRVRVRVSGPLESLYRDSLRTVSVFDSLDTLGKATLYTTSRQARITGLTSERNAAADSAFRNREKVQTNLDLRDPELAWAIGLHVWAVTDAFDEAWHRRHPIRSGRSGLKAGLLSAVIPGAGQVYNERWGKSAMLWMGLCGSWVSQDAHQKTLDFYRREYALAVSDGRGTTAISTQLDLYRKRRNQYYWGMGLLYAYQIIDAVVDARLDEVKRPFRIGLEVAPDRLGLASALSF